eukprot:SAG22_NODE_12922_length_424_cov_2.587692_2_plen_76_part_00
MKAISFGRIREVRSTQLLRQAVAQRRGRMDLSEQLAQFKKQQEAEFTAFQEKMKQQEEEKAAAAAAAAAADGPIR